MRHSWMTKMLAAWRETKGEEGDARKRETGWLVKEKEEGNGDNGDFVFIPSFILYFL